MSDISVVESVSTDSANMEKASLYEGGEILQRQIQKMLRKYFSKLEGVLDAEDSKLDPTDLYELIVNEVEIPLLKKVMRYTGGNQSKAAKILGISRGTLRKKLEKHKLS